MVTEFPRIDKRCARPAHRRLPTPLVRGLAHVGNSGEQAKTWILPREFLQFVEKRGVFRTAVRIREEQPL